MNEYNNSNRVLLGGYAAKQCPVRTQRDFGPEPLSWVPGEEDQARLDAGIAFEAAVFATLTAAHPDAVLVDATLGHDDAIASTLAAMEAGAPLILGGWLPDDCDGGRKGKPDLLIRVGGGYLPADVKHHRTLEAKKTRVAQLSRIASPAVRLPQTGWTSATPYRLSDGLQLAHYTRMLQACGWHPGPDHMWAAILGTTAVQAAADDGELVFVWHDLNEPVGFTYSRDLFKIPVLLVDTDCSSCAGTPVGRFRNAVNRVRPSSTSPRPSRPHRRNSVSRCRGGSRETGCHTRCSLTPPNAPPGDGWLPDQHERGSCTSAHGVLTCDVVALCPCRGRSRWRRRNGF